MYDANGNMTSRRLQTGGTTYSQVWDAENRLISVTAGAQTTSFTYDGNGALVKKVASGQTTVYVGNYYEKQGSAVTKYYYFNGQRVAMKTSSGVSYLAGDHLGTTSVTWNASGVKVAESRHLPYGGVRWTSGTMPTDHRFTEQRLTASLGL